MFRFLAILFWTLFMVTAIILSLELKFPNLSPILGLCWGFGIIFLTLPEA